MEMPNEVARKRRILKPREVDRIRYSSRDRGGWIVERDPAWCGEVAEDRIRRQVDLQDSTVTVFQLERHLKPLGLDDVAVNSA